MTRRFSGQIHDRSARQLEELGLSGASEVWMDRVREVEVPIVLRRLGHFELLEEVGRGGQGIVYRARDTRTNHQLAVKLLLAGPFATPTARNRVRREMSASLALDHPDVAKILDVQTVDGQLLLTMDWVCGLPITIWATGMDEGRRPARDVVETFVRVCDAVHHAHQRGVIHRDIKPSNILVDGAGRPRVLDFGLAKLASTFGPAGAPMTDAGQFLGTPTYASPEQVRGEGYAGDVLSDVYSLGVTLYESLTGVMPYDVSGPLVQVFRAVEQEEPARLAGGGYDVDRELESIVLKALEKDPRRRYQSVDDFRGDLDHYLRGEPVGARTHSTAYVLRKKMGRHKTATALAAVFAALVICYAITATWMYTRAERAARRAEGVQRFLQRTLSSVDPYHIGGEVTLGRLLGKASERIEEELAGQPEVEAGVRFTIANTYIRQWMWAEAEPHARAACALFEELHGEEHPMVAASLDLHGRALSFMYDPRSIQVCGRALALNRRMHGEMHPLTAESMHGLGFALRKTGAPDEQPRAEALYRRALDIHRRVHPGPAHSWARAMYGYAGICQQAGRLDEARENLVQAVEMFRALAGEGGSYYLMRCLLSCGDFHFSVGRVLDAEGFYLEALGLHPDGRPSGQLAGTYWRLAVLAAHLDRDEEARWRYDDALSIMCEIMQDRHPDLAPHLGVHAARLREDTHAGFSYRSLYEDLIPLDPEVADAWVGSDRERANVAEFLRNQPRPNPPHSSK